MIYLPHPPSRARLHSFWCVLSLVGGLLGGCLLAPLFSISWLVSAILSAILMILGFAISGKFCPQLASVPYRAWNKGARLFAHFANQVLISACFFIVHTISGSKGFVLKLAQSDKSSSLWEPTEPQEIGDNEIHDVVAVIEFPDSNGVATFGRWTRKSGKWWLWGLLPLMYLMTIFKEQQTSTSVPTNIYTLY